MAVEAIELVVTALTVGAAAGVKDTATSAVKDAYGVLVQAARRCVWRGRDDAEPSVVEEHAADPEGRREVLVTALTAAGAGSDAELVAAAQGLLAVVDPMGSQAGKYTVDARDAKGVQVGDHNTMHLKF